jgi:putative ABC transport system permease protein
LAALTIRGLLSRKVRAFLTGLAVLLGVAMIAGTYVFTDTINSTFDKVFAEANQGVDVVISGRSEFDTEAGTVSQEIPESLVGRVKEVPGVLVAAGSVEDFASIFKANGDQVKTGGAPPLLFSRPPERFDPLKYVEGEPPATPQEVAINKGTADDEGLKIGDRVSLVGRAGRENFRISGLATFGDVESLGGATVSVVTLPEAQVLADQPGKVDSIQVAAEPGVSPAELVKRVERVMPNTVEVKTGKQDADDEAESIQNSLSFLNILLLVFAGIAVFVGAFIIFNTFSITVAQRTKEFALLRTMGASRGQVLRSVMLEALIVGLIASILGILLGIVTAQGISALFKALGADLPQEGLVLKGRTIIVGLLVGTLVTMIASLAPARRATRVPPLAAMRDELAAPEPPTRRRKVLSWGLLVLGAIAILFSLFGGAPAGQALSMLGLGAIALFIAVALLSPRLVPLIAGAVGRPLERFRGVAGRLARENAMRNPGRTAVTAAALMIGLALVTFVSILADGVKASIDDTVENRMRAELVVLNNDGNFTPISPESAAAVRKVPGVEVVSELKSSQAKVKGAGGKPFGSGIDPRTFDRIWDTDIDKGPPTLFAALQPGQMALEKDFAKANDFEVGDRLEVTTPTGCCGEKRKVFFTVPGIFEDKSGLIGDFMVTGSVMAAKFGQRDDDLQFVGVRGGADVDQVQSRIERLLEQRFPVAEVQNRSEFKDAITGGIDQFLALIYALLSLSVIVSLFGIVNTLVLSIHERTREIGMMRAIGTPRKLVRRIVRYESVITALIGAALGLTVGFILGVVTTVALEDEGFLLSIPVGSLVVFAILAVLAGVLAAIPPARRASRLNVLEALAYE